MNPVAAILGTGASGAPQSTQGKAPVEAAPGFSPLLERALRHAGPAGRGAHDTQRIEGDDAHGTIAAQPASGRAKAAATHASAHAAETHAHEGSTSAVASPVRPRVGGPVAELAQIEGDTPASTGESGPATDASTTGTGDEDVSALTVRPSGSTDVRAAAASAKVERSPEKLEPEFRARLDRVLQRMEDELGFDVRVTETFRTQSRQDALFAQGRTAPGPTVTWTRSSNHTKGLAADIVIEGGDDAAYAKLAKVAAQEGLRTLGSKDPGHIELASSSTRARASSETGPTRLAATGLMARVAAPAAVATVARTAQVAVPGAAIAAPQSDGYRPASSIRTAATAEAGAQNTTSEARTGEAVRNAALANAGIQTTGQGTVGEPRSSIGRGAIAGAERLEARRNAGEAVAARSGTAAGTPPTANPGTAAAGANANAAVATAAEVNAIAAAVANAARANGQVRPTHVRDTALRASVGGESAGPALTSEQAETRGKQDSRAIRAAALSPEPDADRTRRLVNEIVSGRTGAGAGSNETAGVFSTTIEPDGFTDLRAAVANTSHPTGLANAAEAVAGAGGPDIASRVARLLALQDAQRSAPATGVTLEVGPDDGTTAAKIRLGVRGGAIDALIDVADPAMANRLGGRVNELRRALERTGLEPATVLVRELGAGVSAGRGSSASQNQTDPETGRQGWMRRDPGNPEEQKHGRRNSKENER